MGRLNTGGRCPKCRGNLYLDRDYNGWYEQCLQCGFMKDLVVVYENKHRIDEENEKPAPVKRGRKNTIPVGK